jgi:hypothetical protein
MDGRTGKYSANGLAETKRPTNDDQHSVGEIEKLLLFGVFIFLLSATKE